MANLLDQVEDTADMFFPHLFAEYGYHGWLNAYLKYVSIDLMKAV